MANQIKGLIFPVAPGGMPGSVTFEYYGPQARGKWASHTGFRSMAGAYMEYELGTGMVPAAGVVRDQQLAGRIARELYEKQMAYAWLVWEEHKEHGWRPVHEFMGRYEIKPPDWTEGIVPEALEIIGFEWKMYSNGMRYEMRMPVERMEKKKLMRVLKPLCQPNTRFADERILRRQLIAAYSSETAQQEMLL